MPNLKGGKKYKSGKGVETKAEMHEINEADGQMVGRVLKGLGDRNMLLYCNDGKERIAHIRGGLRKKVAKIEIGDVVLFSIRSLDEGSAMKDRGDILAKYEREVHGQLKKLDGINPLLFVNVERGGSGTIQADEDGFEFDDGAGEEEAEGGGANGDGSAQAKRKEAEERKRAVARDAKRGDDDLNIDDI